jgi:hypothetical protein
MRRKLQGCDGSVAESGLMVAVASPWASRRLAAGEPKTGGCVQGPGWSDSSACRRLVALSLCSMIKEHKILMKRINVVLGLAVMAVLALSAFAVSSASAAPELIKAGSPGTKLAKAGIGGKSATGTSTVLETANKTKVTCTSAESKGGVEVTTKEIAKGKFLFKGCTESVFGGSCKSSGKSSGEIETNETTAIIGFNPSHETEVDFEVRPTGTTSELKVAFVTFECTGGFAKIEARGAVIGMFNESELNKSKTSFGLTFAKGATAGTQELTKMTGGFMTEAKLESSLNKGTFEGSNQQGEGTLTTEEAAELT